MIIKPSLNTLLSKRDPATRAKLFDSPYTLVILTAKRARELNNGAEPVTSFHSNKMVTVAIEEINENKIFFKRDPVKTVQTAPTTKIQQSLDQRPESDR
jgi:DNA-directed RNA polymerase subunit omega